MSDINLAALCILFLLTAYAVLVFLLFKTPSEEFVITLGKGESIPPEDLQLTNPRMGDCLVFNGDLQKYVVMRVE